MSKIKYGLIIFFLSTVALLTEMLMQCRCLIKLSVNAKRPGVTFVVESARSYLFHFILSL